MIKRMHKRGSTDILTLTLKIACGCAGVIIVFWIRAASAGAADNLPEVQVPNDLSPALTHLLNLADPDNPQSFQLARIKKLLKYMEEPKDPHAIYFVDPKLGAPSGYYEFDVRQDLEHILKYAFSPHVPSYLISPSLTRLSYWEQVQGSGDRLPVLWNFFDQLETPIIVKGVEIVENTPDMISGAYYRYPLYRTLVLFKINNRKTIISISKQKSISDVGKKGYVLGSDDNWDYFYSGKPGLTIPGLGWVKSYMYNSYGINFYTEIDPDVPLLRCGTYKWVRAGWSKINVVKRHHIHSGMKRFAKPFKYIIEHPRLPSSDAFSDFFSKIETLSDNALKERIKIYLNILKNRYGRNYRPPQTFAPKVFEDPKPWFRMSTEAMQSVLMVEYMKHALGKTDTKGIVALLDLSR